MKDKFYVLWEQTRERYVSVRVNTLGVVSGGFDESLATCSKFDDWLLAREVADVVGNVHFVTLDIVPVFRRGASVEWERYQDATYYVVKDIATGSFYVFDIIVFPTSINLQMVVCYADATRFLNKGMADAMLLVAEERYGKPCKLVPIVAYVNTQTSETAIVTRVEKITKTKEVWAAR